MGYGEDGEGLSLGKKLLISCKIGDFDNIMKLLDQIDELEDDERDTALECTDKKGNTHLHLIVQTDDAIDEFYETPLDDKKVCCYRLLDLALNPEETNDDKDTVWDVCPRDFERILAEHSDKKRRSGFRGMSLVSEGATVTSVKAAGNALMAAAKFKRGPKRAAEAKRLASLGDAAGGSGGNSAADTPTDSPAASMDQKPGGVREI
mmetsp:Transcript_27685/g.54062  ORF Transcript_27685/g.54062 Transcript_27685/m.54062 type:complete len:206 (-) Transcript_27685:277-894(-)